MKKILVIMLLLFTLYPRYYASEIPDTACSLIYDASNVEAGNGGQEYKTNVQIGVINGIDHVDDSVYAGNFDIYDLNGNLVESVTGDYKQSMENNQGLTGLIDGTYTYILDDTYVGTFNVNHEMQAIVTVDMDFYDSCNHDENGTYFNPNSEVATDEASSSESEEPSSKQTEESSEILSEKNDDSQLSFILVGGLAVFIILLIFLIKWINSKKH